MKMALSVSVSHTSRNRVFVLNALIIMSFGIVWVDGQIIPLWSKSLLDGITEDTRPLQYSGHGPLLLSNCDRSAQIYLHEYVYLSNNRFKTPVAPLRIPRNLVLSEQPVVTVAVMRASSFAMVIDGLVIVYHIESATFHKTDGLYGYNVTKLEFAQYCCTHAWCTDWSDFIVALAERQDPQSENDTYGVFAMQHNSHKFFQVDVPVELRQQKLILAIPFLPWHFIGLLARRAGSDESHHDEESAIFYYVSSAPEEEHEKDYHESIIMKAIPFTLEGTHLNAVHMTNRFGEFILWGPRQLFVSQTAGQSVLSVSEELSHFERTEVIQELTPGNSGEFALLTSKGSLWYGRVGLETNVAEMSLKKIRVDAFSAISFDANSFIYIMNAQHYDREPQNNHTRLLVYLPSEVIFPAEVLTGGEHALPVCPFLLFTVKFGAELFYLDIGNTLILRAIYVPAPWQVNAIMIYPSNPSIIKVNTSIGQIEPIGRGVNRIEVLAGVSLTADSPGSLVDTYIEGVTTVKFTTAESSLTCLKNPSLQAFIAAGCPPAKQIKYRKQVNREKCDYLKNYVYTFKRDEYDPTFMEDTYGISAEQDDLSIQYDYGTHGCPDMSYYSDGFKPQFDLYIGDEFIEVMDADYAMIEVYGVHNYQYGMNAKQAGCTRKPQTWVEMFKRQNGTVDNRLAWNRHNYQSCIEEGQPRIEDKSEYHIMNARTDNKIYWREIKAIYIFNVTVLDPKYSYCNLYTQFAVEVYGALPESTVSENKVLIITILVGLGSVALIYIYYILRLKESDEENSEKIPQFPH